jgi:xylulokinase
MGALLGIDLGTSSVRASLMTPEGDVLGIGAQEYPISTPRPGWAEQDPGTWWTATCAAISQALHTGRVRPQDVTAVGLSGQMHGLVLLDPTGAPVRPAIIWPDTRSTEECAEIEERIGKDRLYRITGIPTATGFFGVSLLWVQRREPAVYARAARAVLPKDYVRFRLTGEYATDPTDGSGTLLFDVRKRSWSAEIADALHLERDLLPPVLESSVCAGSILEAASRDTGLPRGTPVAVGGADQVMGAIGSGIVEEGVVACTIGTGGQVFTTVREPVVDPGKRLHTFCHAMPDAWLLMGAMLAAGLSLRWFRDTLGEAEVQEGKRSGVDPYALLVAEAEKAEPGSGGVIFLPYLGGERTPHMDPHARGCLIGLSLSHTRAHLIRAILEGVSFGMKESLSILRELGMPLGTVICLGGGARSRLWRQIQADVYGVPVVKLSSEEHSSFGAGLVAGVASGVYRDIREAARGKVRTAEVVPPVEEHRAMYERQYTIYRALYPALRETFKALKESDGDPGASGRPPGG